MAHVLWGGCEMADPVVGFYISYTPTTERSDLPREGRVPEIWWGLPEGIPSRISVANETNKERFSEIMLAQNSPREFPTRIILENSPT